MSAGNRTLYIYVTLPIIKHKNPVLHFKNVSGCFGYNEQKIQFKMV